MNYPYSLFLRDDLERYIADAKKEPPEIQEEIRQYHLEMGRLCGQAAATVQAIDPPTKPSTMNSKGIAHPIQQALKTPSNHRLFWAMIAGALLGNVFYDFVKALWNHLP